MVRLFGLAAVVTLMLGGCSKQSGISGSNSLQTETSNAYVAELKARPLPPLPPKDQQPKDDKDCLETLQDAAPRRMSIPLNVVTALAETNSKAWAFVKGDVDAGGSYVNLRIVSSSGFKPFDEAALKTVQSWKAKVPPGRTGYKGCISRVSVA